MIRFLTLHNFKCFNDMELSLKNLTLVTGKNAAGKSTVLQSLLLLKQSYELRYLQDSQLCFSDRVVLADLESYASVYSHDPDEGDPSFWIRIEDEKQTEWTFQVAGQEEQGAIVSFQPEYKGDLADCSLFSDSMVYLHAERVSPRKRHIHKTKRNRLESRLGDIHGDGAATLFYDSIDEPLVIPAMAHPEGGPDIASQINAWMNDIMGQHVILSADADPASIILKYGLMDRSGVEVEVSPMNMAFGNSYVFPIVAAILTAPAGSLILLENPEAHLHPAAQVAMGRFLSLAAANGIQLLVETHSDHLLNGVRLAVCSREELDGPRLNPDLVNTYYFYEDKQQVFRHQYCEIEINEDGRLTDWPDGFFDTWEKALIRLNS